MRKNKFKEQTSAGKVMAGVFSYNEGILLEESLKRGATVNSERYVRTLKKMKHRIRSFQPNRQTYQARILPTVSIFAPSVFHLFGPLKVTFRERRLAEHDELKHNVHEER
jgi:hypothetical protein